jgi:hypothetical protein
MMDTSEFDSAEYLRRLFDDVEFSCLVVVAAELGVADLLASGPRSIADLSAATGADAQALYRDELALRLVHGSGRSCSPDPTVGPSCRCCPPPSGFAAGAYCRDWAR